MWNNTDIPLAYLITFRSYGTWLHGDERGSVDRFHNVYATPRLAPDGTRQHLSAARMKAAAVLLDTAQRNAVDMAIQETCAIKKWQLHARNVRTNHVHIVATIGLVKPELALNSFKANATRKMREANCWQFEHSPWAIKGSKRYLWNIASMERACDYVVNGQGDTLPDF